MIRVPPVALALVLAAYLVPLAAPAALMEDDEGLHAAIAQEMVERGDWTVPRLLGQPFLDKPILYFWLQAASIAAFGASELAVRLPGTMVALLGAGAVGWLARAMFGPAIGGWTALCYATMLLPFGVSLSPLHDLVMVPLVTGAVGAYWHARHATSMAAVAGWTLAAGIAVGLSALGKGLTGAGLAGVGVGAWLLWTRALSWRLVAVGAVSLLIGTAVAWPWYAAMERAVPGYLQYFFAERHLAGIADDTQRHGGRPIWYYVPILLAGTLPWGVALWHRGRAMSDAERLLWAWLAADVVVLSLAGSKLATYLLPALPAVAALAAVRIHTALDGSDTATARPLEAAAVGLALVAVPAAPAVAWWLGAPPPALTSYLWGLLPVVAYAWSHRSGHCAPSRLLTVTAATMLTAGVAVLPTVAGRLTAQPLAAAMNREQRVPERLLIVDEGVGSYLFYLRPDLRRGLTADRVTRISRFSLDDVTGRDGAVVAVASDRVPGVLALYDVEGLPPTPERGFLVRPLADFRRRATTVP